MKKAIKRRGGKLSRFFISMILVPIIVFTSWDWDNQKASAYDVAVFSIAEPIILPSANALEKNDFDKISDSYSSVITSYSTPVKQQRSFINIMGRTIGIFDSNNTLINAGSQVARFINNYYPGKFFYGHNSSTVFGGLAKFGPGSIFTITINGNTKKYKVMLNTTVPNDDKLKNNMGDIASAIYNGKSYSVSLMTCAGRSYNTDNATHRTLVFANEI